MEVHDFQPRQQVGAGRVGADIVRFGRYRPVAGFLRRADQPSWQDVAVQRRPAPGDGRLVVAAFEQTVIDPPCQRVDEEG